MLTNQEIVPAVQMREALFTDLYKRCFPAAARYVSRMGGDLEQARDVFQDALLAYYEKSRQGRLKLETSEKAYIMGIVKHLWLKRYRESKTLAWKSAADVAQEEALRPSSVRILHYLEAAGQKCMELLRAFYYEKTGMEEIAGHFGFSGVRSATVQKFKCLEKVREKIREKSLRYEDFLE